MNTCTSALILITAAALIGGCSAEGKLASRGELSGGLWTVKVSSPAFEHQGEIPELYTRDGLNLSPPLKWSAGPAGLKEWVLIVEDADATARSGPGKGRPLCHWLVYKIPAHVTELPERASEDMKYSQGRNYTGETGYAGPNPPKGKKHRYYFQLFALDEVQDFAPGLDGAELVKQFKGHVLSKGQLIGTYTSPKE